MFTSKPPVIRSTPFDTHSPSRHAAVPARRGRATAPGRRESAFRMESKRGPLPWLAMLLIAGLSGAGWWLSDRQGFLLGEMGSLMLGAGGLHGLWRGGFRKIVMLPVGLGTIVLLASRPDFADGLVQRLGVTPGGVTQVASCVIAAVAVFAVSGRVVKYLRERFILKRPLARATDRFVGTGVGLAEGAVFVLALCWSVAALEPQATRVVFSPSVPAGSGQYVLAERILQLGAEIDATPLKPIVRDANPFHEVPALKKLLDGAADGRLDLSGLDPALRAKVEEMLKAADPETMRQVREAAGQLRG